MSDIDLREILEDSLHLSSEIIEEHFGSIEDIRSAQQDREEVEYVTEMKMVSYQIILREVIQWKLGHSSG
jgi:hypothetical protein